MYEQNYMDICCDFASCKYRFPDIKRLVKKKKKKEKKKKKKRKKRKKPENYRVQYKCQ